MPRLYYCSSYLHTMRVEAIYRFEKRVLLDISSIHIKQNKKNSGTIQSQVKYTTPVVLLYRSMCNYRLYFV